MAGSQRLRRTKAQPRTYSHAIIDSAEGGIVRKHQKPQKSSPASSKGSPAKSPQKRSPIKQQVYASSSDSEVGEDEEEEEEYEVEEIVAKGLDENGKIMYKVKWVGYPHSENTWQDLETLHCDELIRQFEDKLAAEATAPSQSKEAPKASPAKRKRLDFEFDDDDDERDFEGVASKRPKNNAKKDKKEKRVGANLKLVSEMKDFTTSAPRIANMLKATASASAANSPPSTNQAQAAQSNHSTQSQTGKNKNNVIEIVPESAAENGGTFQTPETLNDWSDQVDRIRTVIRHPATGTLMIQIMWKNGSITEELAEDANWRCPLHVIRFYESRLKFPSRQ